MKKAITTNKDTFEEGLQNNQQPAKSQLANIKSFSNILNTNNLEFNAA